MVKKLCAVCRFCAELKKPYERSDSAVIYGYCFKDGDKNYNTNMGKGYPIFLPLSCGCSCKSFRRTKKPRSEMPEEEANE